MKLAEKLTTEANTNLGNLLMPNNLPNTAITPGWIIYATSDILRISREILLFRPILDLYANINKGTAGTQPNRETSREISAPILLIKNDDSQKPKNIERTKEIIITLLFALIKSIF